MNSIFKQRISLIKTRCTNPKDVHWKYYGAKGIKCLLTPTELEFIWFRDGASKMKRPTIDRIDPNGHYELNNCRYIEHSENSRRSHLGVPVDWNKAVFEDKICSFCNKKFTPDHPARRGHPKCQRKHRLTYLAQWAREYRRKKK